MRMSLVYKFLLASLLSSVVCGFQTTIVVDSRPRTSFALHAGFGGGAVASKKKKTNTKKTAKKAVAAPFDAGASLLRMEKVYDELSQNEAKRINRADEDDEENPHEMITAEYMVAARAAPWIADWVPVAQIILARPLSEAQGSEGANDPLVRAAISHYCREISHVAAMGSRVFSSIPRHDMQYAVESVESFHKHVYEVAMEGKNENAKNEQVMTKADARRLLQLDEELESSLDLATIKRTYRKMSMEWHPDRFVGQSDEAKDTASAQYAKIKLAYETLQSGVRNGKNQSWYESLGGRARTDFCSIPELLSITQAQTVLTERNARAAVCGLDPTLVQTFVARSQASVPK